MCLSILKTKDKVEHETSEPQSGQLTAGEINDLEKWNEWLNALKSKSHRKIQENWNFYLENKIQVTITDKEGLPVNNVKVSLFNSV